MREAQTEFDWKLDFSHIAQIFRAGRKAPDAMVESHRDRSAPRSVQSLHGQRDFFSAHTYERIDQQRGKFFQIDWLKANRPQFEM